ncbi:MAG: OmpA family protein [Flavobacteriales bacterium]|nr:OmpA family protein [Flavobacteriales bacterium]
MRLAVVICIMLGIQIGFAQESRTHTVFFEYDKFDVNTSESSKLTTWLNTLPDSLAKLEICGYTDFIGWENYNLSLSEKRANNVVAFIENEGILRYKMSLLSFVGEKESVPNESVDGTPKDRKVVVTATFYPKSAELNPVRKDVSEETDLLASAEVGQSIVFSNLNFFPGRHFLIPQALPNLERLAETLKKNPNLEIEIQGHICCKLDSLDGFDQNTHTYELSVNRAKYIHDQLILNGVTNKMTFRGFAGKRPLIFPEVTDEDRQRNRRVEIKVTKK